MDRVERCMWWSGGVLLAILLVDAVVTRSWMVLALCLLVALLSGRSVVHRLGSAPSP